MLSQDVIAFLTLGIGKVFFLNVLYQHATQDVITFLTLGIGKVFFLYQHATFITAGSDPAGSLADITLENTQESLLAFVRLVGCAYFKNTL